MHKCIRLSKNTFHPLDKATVLFYKMYDAKSAENAEDFIKHCWEFFPFKITHILTDNGLEFTNALLKSKNGKNCTKPSKVDELCKQESIEHRLTKPHTPKTNGMVERANGIIKSNTILRQQYQSKQEMEEHLLEFLVFYLLYRRHGSLKRELGVKTPFEAVEKWFELNPEIFIENPLQFINKILLLHRQTCIERSRNIKSKQGCFTQQPCET